MQRRRARMRDPGRTSAHGAPTHVRADRRDRRGSRCVTRAGSIHRPCHPAREQRARADHSALHAHSRHGTRGRLCAIYLDEAADREKAQRAVLDAKVRTCAGWGKLWVGD